MNRTHLT